MTPKNRENSAELPLVNGHLSNETYFRYWSLSYAASAFSKDKGYFKDVISARALCSEIADVLTLEDRESFAADVERRLLHALGQNRLRDWKRPEEHIAAIKNYLIQQCPADDILADDATEWAMDVDLPIKSHVACETLLAAMEPFMEALRPDIETSPIEKRLQEAKKLFGLSGLSIRIVRMALVRHHETTQESQVFRALLSKRLLGEIESIKNFLRLRRNETRQVRRDLFNLSYRYGLLGERHENNSLQSLYLNSEFNGLLLGALSTEAYIETLYEEHHQPLTWCHPSTTCWLTEDTELVKRTVFGSRGDHVLIEGPTGTGKTTGVRQLITSAGATVISIPAYHDYEYDCWSSMRLKRIFRAKKVLEHSTRKLVIVIDDAEPLLTAKNTFALTGTPFNTGLMNEVLKPGNVPFIWICESTRNIPKELIGNFTFSLKLTETTFRERVKIWNEALIPHPTVAAVLCDADIERLSREFPVDAATIISAVDNIHRLDVQPDHYLEALRRTLEAAINLRAPLGRPSHHPGPRFPLDINYLTADIDLRGLADVIKTSQSQTSSPIGLNVLLSGPPGTGKSEFVRHLASVTGLELMSLTASELISPFQGQTEKNISAAFSKAEKSKSILMIDEVDSLLSPRGLATKRWQVSHVNELLCAMERHRGVFICATNREGFMDHAAARRFTFKARFDYLKPEASLAFFKATFAALYPGGAIPELTVKDISAIQSLTTLTPGDFAVVATRYILTGPEHPTPQDLIDALRREIKLNAHTTPVPIGFGAPGERQVKLESEAKNIFQTGLNGKKVSW